MEDQEYSKFLIEALSFGKKRKDNKDNDYIGYIPKFIRSKCKSYGDCLNVCPVSAISGNAKLKTINIDVKKCIKCGACMEECKAKAIVPVDMKKKL